LRTVDWGIDLSLFLLGAGFNADAKREAGLVLGAVSQSPIECGYLRVADAAHLCFPAGIPADKSIEEQFSDALQAGNYEPLGKLLDSLMEADYYLASQLSAQGQLNCYREFFDAFVGSNFLTFNYDSLPEIFLYRVGNWFPHDGYGVPVNVELAFGAPEFGDRKSASVVLHLHGSSCIYTSESEIRRRHGEAFDLLIPREGARFFFDPLSISQCFPHYRRASSNTGHVRIEDRVIAPVPNKAQGLKETFISESYGRALPLVRNSGTVVAVGYSFNRHDSASYDPILQTLSETNTRRLVIVSPDANRLAVRIGAEYRRIRVEPIEKTLKSWAMNSFDFVEQNLQNDTEEAHR
jgi:hypothetical protein